MRSNPNKDQEMGGSSSMNSPLRSGTGSSSSSSNSGAAAAVMTGHAVVTEEMRSTVGQIQVPWERVECYLDPTFMMSDGKVVKYDSGMMAIWRALVSTSFTIILDGTTWSHLSILTVVCFVTMTIVMLTDTHKSISDDYAVVGRIQLLISFVLASYVSIVVNRWDRIRNQLLGVIWSSLENLNYASYSLMSRDKSEKATKLQDTVMRYSRAVMLLTFYAVQERDDLDFLTSQGLLTPNEAAWLSAATPVTRPHMVVGWISRTFEEILESGYKHALVNSIGLVGYITTLRGAIESTISTVNCQLPYSYVHIVYWTIQIMLTALSIETGVNLAVFTFSDANGNGDYSPGDDTVEWPEQPRVWYLNKFLQITAANVVFALFCEGLLNVCDKLHNPMSSHPTSFSEVAYDAMFYNNCRSMRAGILSFESLDSSRATQSAAGGSKS